LEKGLLENTPQKSRAEARRDEERDTRKQQFRHTYCAFFEIDAQGNMTVMPEGASAERLLNADGDVPFKPKE
jgi:hypothetical protein